MEKVKIGNSYAYLEIHQQTLTLDEPRPAVIICPGGAYFYTSNREATPVANEFLVRGYTVFVLHYSTMSTKRMVEDGLDFEQSKEDIESVINHSSEQPSEFPQPLIELGLAMKYVHQHAKKYNVDPSRIVTCGFSAGANLITLLGSYWHQEWLQSAVETSGEILKPAAQIVCYGYMDSISLGDFDSIDLDNMVEAMHRATFNKTEVSETELKKVSPTLLVDSKTPASFVWHTREDALIPVEQSLNFCLALQKHNVPWELHVFDKGAHGLSVATSASGVVNDHVHEWLNLFNTWFNTL
ncbi:alpha/beta hydrolase [Erysipelothrix urinaevulpis]|uniref:alpha/beta hydrolase n=1 Tax=Erysipelothrix urinaevulpis TaxID=2683717 RepID=UPI001356EBFE|nr:alpha/beta hydrolase [Erysipelothrix urinaevulpis]